MRTHFSQSARRFFHVIGMAVAPLAALLAVGQIAPVQAADDEVNVYSYRQEVLLRPLLDAFTEDTGIAVNLVSGKADALLERLKHEGANSPADVLLTVDAGRLHRATVADLLQPVRSDALEANVPAQYRHPEGYWYGLSVRARPIFYARDRVDPGELSTYAALADAKWKGRICIRSSNNIYNQSLLASLIAHDGAAATAAWSEAFVANFARKPQGGDRDQLRAVAAGQCDLAIANTYYLGQLTQASSADDRTAASKVGVFWPNQDDRGVHVNISGAAVTKSAKNKANAIRLLEFLSDDRAQRLYAEGVNEYPVKPGVPWSDIVAAWGEFKADDLNLSLLGENNPEAVKIADRAGWR
jgi:iron(III) transport system substrate-binding protein